MSPAKRGTARRVSHRNDQRALAAGIGGIGRTGNHAYRTRVSVSLDPECMWLSNSIIEAAERSVCVRSNSCPWPTRRLTFRT
jgi:hypothetical protein